MRYMDFLQELTTKISFCYDDGVCMSYPVPDKINGIAVDKVFLYRRSILKKTGSRPFAVLETSADTGNILLLADCHIQDFVDVAKHPFSTELDYSMPPTESMQVFQMKQQMLRKMYEGIRTFAFQETLTPEQKELLNKYTFLLQNAVPKALLPYYEALSPQYTAWVKKYLD